MLSTGSIHVDAERAFDQAARARRRASLFRRLRRACLECARLAIYEHPMPRRAGAAGGRGVREIPLDAITATLEPSRADQFDHAFRPAPRTRARWTRVWLAARSGAHLPPISLVPFGDGYAIRDGHHRVSVAHALGARTIDAIVEGF